MLIKSKFKAHSKHIWTAARNAWSFRCRSRPMSSRQCNFFDAVICFWISTARCFRLLRLFRSARQRTDLWWAGMEISSVISYCHQQAGWLCMPWARTAHRTTMNMKTNGHRKDIFAAHSRNKHIKMRKWQNTRSKKIGAQWAFVLEIARAACINVFSVVLGVFVYHGVACFLVTCFLSIRIQVNNN